MQVVFLMVTNLGLGEWRILVSLSVIIINVQIAHICFTYDDLAPVSNVHAISEKGGSLLFWYTWTTNFKSGIDL